MYKQIEENITSAFVYGYLIENGHYNLAKQLQSMKQIPNRHGLQLQNLLDHHFELNDKFRSEKQSFSDEIVLKYFKSKGHYKLASKLKKIIHYQNCHSEFSIPDLNLVYERFFNDSKIQQHELVLIKEMFQSRVTEITKLTKEGSDLRRGLIFVLSTDEIHSQCHRPKIINS